MGKPHLREAAPMNPWFLSPPIMHMAFGISDDRGSCTPARSKSSKVGFSECGFLPIPSYRKSRFSGLGNPLSDILMNDSGPDIKNRRPCAGRRKVRIRTAKPCFSACEKLPVMRPFLAVIISRERTPADANQDAYAAAQADPADRRPCTGVVSFSQLAPAAFPKS